MSYYCFNELGGLASGRLASMILQGEGCLACAGGQGTFTFSYGNNFYPAANEYDFNTWFKKTAETYPDGTVKTHYYNVYDEELLSVVTDPASGQSFGDDENGTGAVIKSCSGSE